jgi:beta-glucosidase
MRGRTYRFAETEPLYPFGFGLTYSRLAYGPFAASAGELGASGRVAVRATVANEGAFAVAEAVQCYVVPPRDWPDAPRSTLVDFQKISLAPGESRSVEFTLPAAAFAQTDADGRKVHHPGRYGVVIGSASPGPRAQALGAPAPATGTLTLV